MREILFRAKTKATKEWTYGYFAKQYDVPQIYAGNGHECIYEYTIGQYTGLNDTRGNKIFENDILQVNYQDSEIGRVCIYHKFAMYLCDIIYGDIDFDTLGMLDANYQLEVIGNIYDNPELLSKESECV